MDKKKYNSEKYNIWFKKISYRKITKLNYNYIDKLYR